MKLTSKTTFAKHLSAARKDHGWTQSDLAKRTGLKTSAISHFETGARKNPSLKNLVKLCRALGISADSLLGLPPVDKDHLHMDDPWPTADVLDKLSDAASILLNDKCYDRDGWEAIQHCAILAAARAAEMRGSLRNPGEETKRVKAPRAI